MRPSFTKARSRTWAWAVVPLLAGCTAASTTACNALFDHDPGLAANDLADSGHEGATAVAAVDASVGRDAAPILVSDACADACQAPPIPDPLACPVSCGGALCTPKLLGGNQSGASAITVYQNNVYWTNNLGGTVMVSPADGSSAAMALATGQLHPSGIYVEAGGVFWASLGTGNLDGSITRANFDGTNPQQLAMYGDANQLIGLAGYLYWSEIGTGTNISTLVRMGTTGLNERSISENLPKTPTSLAADASGIYWTTPATGTISKAAIGCLYQDSHTCASSVMNGRSNPIAIAVGNGDLYWAEDGNVVTTRTDGTCATSACPRVLAAAQVAPIGIVFVDDELFWINQGTGMNDGTVMFARKDGSCATVLAAAQATPVSIAVDANRVYWLNSGGVGPFANGAAQSVARPGR